jgi:hypothetical protein
MENLNVKIEKLDGNTLTVLQGSFVAPKEPVKIEISGNIDSPVNFLIERVSELTLKKMSSHCKPGKYDNHPYNKRG